MVSSVSSSEGYGACEHIPQGEGCGFGVGVALSGSMRACTRTLQQVQTTVG